VNTEKLIFRHKSLHAEGRIFLGTHADAEDVKDWADGAQISWVPADENWNDPEDEGPDLSKGVELDVVGHLGYQTARGGDWLIKDDQGVVVLTEQLLHHYYEET
jgi:hypothetical protein